MLYHSLFYLNENPGKINKINIGTGFDFKHEFHKSCKLKKKIHYSN